MHPYFPKSVFQVLEGQGIIKIFGIGRVDGKGGSFPKVPSLFYFLRADFIRNLFCMLPPLLQKI